MLDVILEVYLGIFAQIKLHIVSILIVLDVILEVHMLFVCLRQSQVSILIVLDVILEAPKKTGYDIVRKSFNPYCVGCNLRSDHHAANTFNLI